jgi:tRNA A-37 threonylcarbamoyl transferase component Bud32
MDKAVKHHFNMDIVEKIKLPYGWKETWLLVLSDNRKIVFRTHKTRPGTAKDVIDNFNEDMANVYKREKFFYDNVNKKLGNICPNVYILDDTCDYYEYSFQISEYIEGKNLASCIEEDFDERMKKDVYYKIGEITAQINNMEIDKNHFYITSRNSWEDYFATKLYDKLILLVKNNFITNDEIDKICGNMRNKKATHKLSFMHLDIRPHNMIYRNGDLFILDAEECGFGDPLNEMAYINLEWKMWEMYDILLKGYKSVSDIDLDNELYYYYQLEKLGFILEMHFNRDCMNSWTQLYLNMFNEVKEKVLY